MNEDLKVIKSKYGEKLMHYCRENFQDILEHPGVLKDIILSTFAPQKFLYDDIMNDCDCKELFINSIYDKFNDSSCKRKTGTNKTPSELLDEAGYILYECKTEADIQKFKKYYAKNEKLCTFRGGRLKHCHVFFAVKKDVDKIKREDFQNPQRQDAYGTSVISIQFNRDDSHMLSIKNRYNHTVDEPDATFSNNLDNIIPGLTESFENHYGLIQKFVSPNDLEAIGYVMANDGRFYKCYSEINNIYYGVNNTIIDNFKVKYFPPEQYLLCDFYIINLKTAEIKLYDSTIKDCFIETIPPCKKAEVYKEGELKKVCLTTPDDKKIVIVIDGTNQIVGLENPWVEEIGDNFMFYNDYMRKLSLPNVKKVGNNFMNNNYYLEEISMSNLIQAGDDFLGNNYELRNLAMPCLESVGSRFLYSNKELIKLNTPNLKQIGFGYLATHPEYQGIIILDIPMESHHI